MTNKRNQSDAQRLQVYLDAEGLLKSMPRRQSDRLVVLGYLASCFDAGRSYSEAEVNTLLTSKHSFGDHAWLRRELFENKFLDRARNGAAYQRL